MSVADDFNQQDLDSRFIRAVEGINLPKALGLLDQGANIDARDMRAESDTYECTGLMISVIDNHPHLTRALALAGADLDARGPRNMTALIIAARLDDANAVKLLLVGGADHTLKTDTGETALDIAKQLGHTSAITLLERVAKLSEISPPAATPQLKSAAS